MSAADAERRLAAIASGDLAGYSRHMAQDEDSTVRAVQAHRERVERLATAHHGRLVDFTGDNFLAEFPSALDAVRFSIEVQRGTGDAPDAQALSFRIGVHLGDVRIRASGLLRIGGPKNPGRSHRESRSMKLELR